MDIKKASVPAIKDESEPSVVPPLFICTSLYKSHRVRQILIILRQYNGCNRHSLISEGVQLTARGCIQEFV
jgi:hypothetical protein